MICSTAINIRTRGFLIQINYNKPRYVMETRYLHRAVGRAAATAAMAAALFDIL